MSSVYGRLRCHLAIGAGEQSAGERANCRTTILRQGPAGRMEIGVDLVLRAERLGGDRLGDLRAAFRSANRAVNSMLAPWVSRYPQHRPFQRRAWGRRAMIRLACCSGT